MATGQSINFGQAFLKGELTSVFTSSAIADLMSSVVAVEDIKQNTIQIARETAVQNMKNLAAASGAALGATYSGVIGTMISAQQTFSTAASAASQAIGDIVSYAGKKVASDLVAIVTPPSLSDITSKAGKYYAEQMSDVIKEAKETFFEDTEKTAEKNVMMNVTSAVQNVASRITGAVNAVTGFVNQYTSTVSTGVGNITAYMGQGGDWTAAKVDEYKAGAQAAIGKFVDTQAQAILKTKEQAVDGLAKTIAEKMADATRKPIEKALQKARDEVNIGKQDLKSKASTKIQKAVLNLLAKIGA